MVRMATPPMQVQLFRTYAAVLHCHVGQAISLQVTIMPTEKKFARLKSHTEARLAVILDSRTCRGNIAQRQTFEPTHGLLPGAKFDIATKFAILQGCWPRTSQTSMSRHLTIKPPFLFLNINLHF